MAALKDDDVDSSPDGLFRVRAFLLLCGIVTKANGIFLAINQNWFHLDYTKTMLAPLFFFFASVFIAPIAGGALVRFGFKPGMLFGILVCVFSTLGMFCSHFLRQYPLFLISIFLLGLGVKFLLVAGSSFAVVFGPKKTESGRLSVTQAFYSIGALLCPGIFWFLFSSSFFSNEKVVTFSYLSFFFFWIALSLAIYAIRSLGASDTKGPSLSLKEIFPPFTRSVVMSFFAMFLYMGVEVSLDSLLLKFLTSEEGASLSLSTAMIYFSLYHLGFVIGRFGGGRILNKASLPVVLGVNSFIAMVVFSLAIWQSGNMVIAAAVILGLCNSVLYPLIFAIGVKEEKCPPSKVIGFLSTASLGGALLPLLQGILADRFGLRLSFLLPFISYIGLLLYARAVHARMQARLPVQEMEN